jgi:hypothetical protein
MITRRFSLVLFAGLLVTALLTGCKSEPEKYAQRVTRLTPKGWDAFATNDVIVVRRKEPIWTMGK